MKSLFVHSTNLTLYVLGLISQAGDMIGVMTVTVLLMVKSVWFESTQMWERMDDEW
jgi:hypothetical protein